VTAVARRHCMVVHAYYPVGETRVQRQAAALIAAGFEVDVICLRGAEEDKSEVVDGVRVRRLPVGRHRGSGMLVQLLEYLVFLLLATVVVGARHLRRRYDVVQIHNLPDFLVFSGLVPKLTGSPVILDIHDLMPEFFRSRTGLPVGHPLHGLVRWEERLSVGFADHVITVTEGWGRELSSRGGGEAVSVVMNVADPDVFRRRPEPAPTDAFSIVYHGTFAERYGVLLLVEAVAELSRSRDNVRLHLLGDGEIRPRIVSLIEELGVGGIVSVSPGMMAARDIVPVLEAASIGVVPNLSNVFTDGLLPTKLLEYVAVGVPVVAARTPMIESYFDEDQVAYFEPGNQDDLVAVLGKLASDVELGLSLARAANRFNQAHDWQSESTRYVDLVERLASSRRR
jgi:glycosyltransferase involved in cell wall biosynthesis